MKNIKLKTLGLAAAGILSLGFAGSVSAWGPERATFTMEDPADYPVFNSITNNPTIGDERDFVRIGEINTDVTNLTNEVEIIPGKQYLVYIYFHNNASATYNDAEHNRAGVAVGAKMSTTFPTVIKAGEQGKVSATITADNSNPTSVWDEAYFTTNANKVVLNYVEGSAKIYNDWGANGSVMPSNLFSEGGTFIGLNALNGVIPGCEEYHGVVSYVVEARELAGSVTKTVSLDDENYTEGIEATPGAELYYKLTIKNAGDIALSNATIKDSLPNGLTLIPGSTQLSANDSGVWDALSDDLTGNGFNLGALGTGNTVTIKYRAKIAEDIDCDSLSIINNATFTYDSDTATGDADSDSATVTVKKDGCAPVTIEDCKNNPNLPGCDTALPSEIVKTGPAEIVMAVIIVLGIAAGGFYYWRTQRTLKTVQKVVSGGADEKESDNMTGQSAQENAKANTKTKESK